MNFLECYLLIKDLDTDKKTDLIMYLAEVLNYRVTKDGKDATYFLSTEEYDKYIDEKTKLDDKISEAIDYAIERYKETFKKLAE